MDRIRAMKYTSPDKLSAKSGVGRTTIMRWISGEGEATLGNFAMVLNSLGYRLEIVEMEDAPRQDQRNYNHEIQDRTTRIQEIKRRAEERIKRINAMKESIQDDLVDAEEGKEKGNE